MEPVRTCLAALALTLAIKEVVRADIQYSVTELSPYATSSQIVSTVVSGINNSGVAVGAVNEQANVNVSNYSTAVMWAAGSTTAVALPAVSSVFGDTASSINDSGNIVGAASFPLGSSAFFYSPSSGIVASGISGGYRHINNYNEVVGGVGDGAALWDAAGNYHRLPVPAPYSSASGINDNHQAVGGYGYGQGDSTAVLWPGDGTYTVLNSLPGYSYANATAINNAGRIVGGASNSVGPEIGVIWNSGVPSNLGTLSPGQNTNANAINSQGMVVGDSNGHAFVWNSSSGIKDLNNKLDASGNGWTLSSAVSINNAGQIVGNGIDPQGHSSAFLLTPNGWQAPPPPPTIDPANPPTQLHRYNFIVGLQPSLSWTPLTIGSKVELDIPGITPFNWNESVSFPSQPLAPVIGPWQASFGTNNNLIGSTLNSLTPINWNALVATGTIGIQGGITAQAGVTLKDGSSNATIAATFEAGLTAYGDISINGGIKNLVSVDGLIPLPNSFHVDLPIPGASADIPPLTFTNIPIGETFNYAGFKQAVASLTGLTVPNLTGTITVDGVPITFDDTNSSVFVGVTAQSVIFAESSATFSLDAYIKQGTGGPTLASALAGNVATILPLSAAPAITSPTGTVFVGLDNSVTLKTGSPVWINFALTPEVSFNEILFNAQFKSTDVGDGILAVYLDGNLIGLLDETNTGHDLQSFLFDVPMQDDGEHILGFRLDPTGVDSSSVVISDASVIFDTSLNSVPEPASLSLLLIGGIPLLLRPKRRRRAITLS